MWETLRLDWLDYIVSEHWKEYILKRGYSVIDNIDEAIKQLENIDIFLSEEKILELKKKEKENNS